MTNPDVICLKEHPELYTGSICMRCGKTASECPSPSIQQESEGEAISAEEILLKHIPNGCINIKGGYEAEKKAIISAMEEYAASRTPSAEEIEQAADHIVEPNKMADEEKARAIADIENAITEARMAYTSYKPGTYQLREAAYTAAFAAIYNKCILKK